MKSIGLDIGTTTICGLVVESGNGEILDSMIRKNDSAIKGAEAYTRLQDVDRIREICGQMMSAFLEKHEDIVSLGVTGQMHGILYVDAEGRPVSPLYSWQDERGNQLYNESQTYSEYLTVESGYPMATGYGLTTHFYNLTNNLVPETAVVMCTIPDYIAMYFANEKCPVLHESMAASLGLFRVRTGKWEEKALRKLGIGQELLPSLYKKKTNLRKSKNSYFVAPALGDNQASFLGAVGAESDILINVGTGSQISVHTKDYNAEADIEYRPFIEDDYLMVGAPLCGGASYALLKQFFHSVLDMFQCTLPENMYEIMNEGASQVSWNRDIPTVDTRFSGTRKEPKQRGSIQDITVSNFTPECLTLAVLQGISRELYEIYREVPENSRLSNLMIGSGNGIRQNPVLQREIENCFGKKLLIPANSEEASYGAALYSFYCAGIIETVEDIKKLVHME